VKRCPAAREDAGPDKHFVNGARLQPPFPAAPSWRRSRSAASGARRRSSGSSRRLQHRGRLRGRLDAEPDLPRGLLGLTGHTEVVQVVFDPKVVSYASCCGVLGEPRPDAGDAAGQRRRHAVSSAIYTHGDAQRADAIASRDAYARALADAGHGAITTEIAPAPEFFYAEDYHQQYLAKNPDGYCGIGGTGVSCPSAPASPRRAELAGGNAAITFAVCRRDQP
jgi:peptide-methionine (S)-S-oxide reductase